MKVGLVVLTPGRWEGQIIPIRHSLFLIGRDPQCDLRPASALISKRLCALLVRGRKVLVCDLDSLNGTFVNNEPVKGGRELHHEDRLKVGPLLFAVRMEATPGVEQPPPLPPTKFAST